MVSESPEYGCFLERLQSYERFEPYPRSRGVEKLAGVKQLAGELGHPEQAFRVVHVAGTNGKGMTAAMIARLLKRSGAPTGLYTSPHLTDIRERIVLRGEWISASLFARAGHRVLNLADPLRERVHFSYFDLLTLIALEAFRSDGMEWAVLETGLGGLSDATNISPKVLCVITRIGMDHMHVLGDTLQAIAAQKLGIVPPGVPTVLAEQPPALVPWMRARLAERGSPLTQAADFGLVPSRRRSERLRVRWPDGSRFSVAADVAPDAPPDGPPNVPPDGPPGHLTPPKLACAANALAAGEVLLGAAHGAERAARLRTVLATHLPGRLELRHRQRVAHHEGPPLQTIVLDGGHNAEAMAALVAQLRVWGISDYALLLALQSDKLVAALHEPLRDLLSGAGRIITLPPQTPRAPSFAELAAFLRPLLPPRGRAAPIETVAGPREALHALAERPAQPVVLAGSFWMLGDMMRLLEDDAPPAGGTGGAR